MTPDRLVLVVDKASCALSGVMLELDELGFRVVWVPSLSTALEFITAHPTLPLVIASSAATCDGGMEFLAQVKAIAPDVRLIWGARAEAPNATSASMFAQCPNSPISDTFRSDELRTAISDLLAEHFYPPAIVEAIKTAALEVLGTVGGFELDGGAFLAANRTALSDISAVIPFSGGISGHLLVGLSTDHARILHQAFLPAAHAVRIDRLEDLVGELCNQILGRINVFFATHDVSVQHGTPIYIRAPGGTLRYPGRHPSFAVSLTRGEVRLVLEYYLSDFDRSKLESPVATRILPRDEIRYL
jgi:CheY-specific phosphatase CheX